MENIFLSIHSKQFVEGTLDRIKSILFELYGTEKGEHNYNYLVKAGKKYIASLSPEERERLKNFNPAKPYEHLKGKIFAISYPDNIYTHETPTLKTLSHVLEQYFPGINGIHILPEREMSHSDVWPQDFFSFLNKDDAPALVEFLKRQGLLDNYRILTEKYEKQRDVLGTEHLVPWLEERNVQNTTGTAENIMGILDSAFNSHFNDGGFSQKTRAKIDRRFGTIDNLREITSRYSVMLDYVVNHLDIDNEYLECYRKGENSGDAFIIITPVEYEEMKANGDLAKTFRPRPFPLFTGVRRYPKKELSSLSARANEVNRIFTERKISPLDDRLILFFSIYFKVRNDQGLTAEDKRIFTGFCDYLTERGIPLENIFTESTIQPAGQKFIQTIEKGLPELVRVLGLQDQYSTLFTQNDDEVFGKKFYVYTTFSESQADINPVSESGFKMIIDDLFHLLSSGRLAMMRMDAIKYLWKEKGKKNFDMEEGNKLIEVVQRIMQLTAPGVLPLDEVNSPDPVVYTMEKDGGFAYLFGQVNTTVIAFNEESLQPLEHFYSQFKKKRPENFVSFIMLSTHDGRSVQGLGVQRTDGHVSIEQFYHLKETIEKQGGKAKYRSVPRGRIAADTFNKVIIESGLSGCKDALLSLFTNESVTAGDMYVLEQTQQGKEILLEKMAAICLKTKEELRGVPAVEYFLDWIGEGRTVYELCAASRSSFAAGGGARLSPIPEARRFAAAQAFVLTFGQAVPAIYFNDLLGLKNDREGFELSGKPRDLNRHKSYLPGLDLENPSDPFRKEYLPLINTLLRIRGKDDAFYPGSDDFEFLSLNDRVFLNHPFHRGKHSFIIGNISAEPQHVKLVFSQLSGSPAMKNLTDSISGKTFYSGEEGVLSLNMEPYGICWLSAGQ